MAVQHLPQAEQDYLNEIREDLPLLRARVHDLRAQGWTLAAIGEPLQARRSTVRSWELHPDRSPSLASPPLPAPPNLRPTPSPSFHSSHSRPRPSVRALRPDVPLFDRTQIAYLAPLARRVRGGTAPNSEYRRAKAELNALLVRYYSRGVPIQRLAELTGVSYRAMKVRLDAARAAHPSSPKAAGL